MEELDCENLVMNTDTMRFMVLTTLIALQSLYSMGLQAQSSAVSVPAGLEEGDGTDDLPTPAGVRGLAPGDLTF